MTQIAVIDKNSKLFQKFMQSKCQRANSAVKDHPHNTLSNENKEVTKQNSSLAANQNEHFWTKEVEKSNKSSIEMENKSNKEKEFKNKIIEQAPKNYRLVNNSLNIENGMGLDKILKRAIEKVRQSKIQQLCSKKNSPKVEQDDSLQELKISKSQATSSYLQELTQRNSIKKQKNEQPQLSKGESSQFSLGHSRFTSKDKELQSDQVSETKQSCLTNQINQLKLQLAQQKSQNQALLVQLKQLKREMNEQFHLNQDLMKQKEEQHEQIKYLEGVIEERDKKIKKYSDESNHYRNQSQLINISLQTVKKSNLILTTKVEKLNEQNESIKKQLQNKNPQVQQLQAQLKKTKEQNQLAKQYLYELTIKLYNYEQQIMKMKGHDIYRSQLQSMQHKKQETERITEEIKEINDRKRQFSRERTISKHENRPEPFKQQKIYLKTEIQESSIPENEQQRCSQKIETDTSRQAKRAAIQLQLASLLQQKVINGKVRRRKIQLLRQLQQYKK